MALTWQNNRLVLTVLAAVCLFSVLTIPVAAGSADESEILFHHEDYDFTQRNVDELILFGEYLARSKFSKADKQALRIWSIEDFKSAITDSIGFYTSLRNTLLPKIKASPDDEVYRANLYRGVVNNFNQHPEYAASPDNFLAIVDRYEPPREEAAQLQQFYANMVIQKMQLNQRLFDQSMQQSNQSTEAMSNSIRDQSLRQSITLPGGRIIQEWDDRILAEDPDGRRYELYK